MPACRYNPQQTICHRDNDVSFNGLDPVSKYVCKQEYERESCGSLIPGRRPNLGNATRALRYDARALRHPVRNYNADGRLFMAPSRHRTSKRKLRRRQTRQRR
jgi:hypothetical protein